MSNYSTPSECLFSFRLKKMNSDHLVELGNGLYSNRNGEYDLMNHEPGYGSDSDSDDAICHQDPYDLAYDSEEERMRGPGVQYYRAGGYDDCDLPYYTGYDSSDDDDDDDDEEIIEVEAEDAFSDFRDLCRVGGVVW